VCVYVCVCVCVCVCVFVCVCVCVAISIFVRCVAQSYISFAQETYYCATDTDTDTRADADADVDTDTHIDTDTDADTQAHAHTHTHTHKHTTCSKAFWNKCQLSKQRLCKRVVQKSPITYASSVPHTHKCTRTRASTRTRTRTRTHLHTHAHTHTHTQPLYDLEAASRQNRCGLEVASRPEKTYACVCVCVCKCVRVCACAHTHSPRGELEVASRSPRGYGVATISRLLKITGLFCRISSLL